MIHSKSSTEGATEELPKPTPLDPQPDAPSIDASSSPAIDAPDHTETAKKAAKVDEDVAATTFDPHPDDPVLDDGVGHGPQLFMLALLLLMAGLLFWGHFGTLDIVSFTEGEVIPATQIKEVQHLEGGIVREILVKEGEKVVQNQPLVHLETTASGADVNELEIRIVAMTLEVTRLEAEAEGRESLNFEPTMEKEHPDLVRETRRLFQAQRSSLRDQLDRQKAAINQRRQLAAEVQARIRNSRSRLKLVREQVRISERLLKKNITNRYKHLDLLKEEHILTSQIEEDRIVLRRNQALISEARNELSGLQSAYNAEAGKQLEESRRHLQEMTARLEKFQDHLSRTTLLAPVAGVIKTLHVFTRGGVIKPGDTVVEIVPGDDRLVIEARLPIQDIGYILPGQLAIIKLATADALRFGQLDGKVVWVSPDTLIGEDGAPYYKARVETPQSEFRNGENVYRLYPGMLVSVNIHTGRRTVLEYVFSPFLNAVGTAMGER
ncbi:MAG: HlyD family type I secretion periplasmic adaptor subunit [Magnetococcales bacterium]|nr:HlyD family type I secretion periplasmic adaptor subunit [Magnetococcales bacterium]